MCEKPGEGLLVPYDGLTRRAFAATAAAATFGIGGRAFAAAEVVEKAVTVATRDGQCDAFIYYPAGSGRWPGVLIWTDAVGTRDAFRDMARRQASSGYVVLLPNPYYRSLKGPTGVSFYEPEGRQTVTRYRQAITDDGAAADGQAYLAFLDSQPQTSKAKMGVQGYCMGSGLAFLTAATVPNRIGAVASFHGGNGLVTAQPSSPHLLIGKLNAHYLFAIAKNDDETNPDVKNVLSQTLKETGRPGLVEVYQATHGWCVPDVRVYDQPEAERAWDRLIKMYAVSLV